VNCWAALLLPNQQPNSIRSAVAMWRRDAEGSNRQQVWSSSDFVKHCRWPTGSRWMSMGIMRARGSIEFASMARDLVVGISVVLLVVTVMWLYAREKCRLGKVDWTICSTMGMPTVGGPPRFLLLDRPH
jgi:hypothetical protein